MLELFANPAFLVAGAALVSAPIIIHLINRMRFKRIRWAAMEFLLKAQKKSRRRLIIEQLLLLALRCFLVALAGLLVSRFVGFSFGDFFQGQESVHILLLDDSLSMNDQWKDNEGQNDAFKVAKKDVIIDSILKNISQSTSSERVVLIPLSRLATDKDFQPTQYKPRGSESEIKRLTDDVNALQCSKLHIDLVQGLNKAKEIAGNSPNSRVFVHVISDFRKKDWAGPEAKSLQDTVVALTKEKIKVRLVDCVHPYRVVGQGGLPVSHDNLGIVDFRASTRVTGNGMPILFTITVANYSPRDADVEIDVYDVITGARDQEVTFNERRPFKVPANGLAVATFERRYNKEIKEGESAFLQLFAQLENPDKSALDDALHEDNVRTVTVELRNKVPILVVDGLGADGRKENGDSFFLEAALNSVPGNTYEVVFGDKLPDTGGDARVALDNPDLSNYPTILLLNVASLTEKQLANLENFVKHGGGVGIFMGPAVEPTFYNDKLYNAGQGLFPAPLEQNYYPASGKPALNPEFTGRFQLLLRDDQFPTGEKLPVFGPVLKDAQLRNFMKHLPVKRYFPTKPSDKWVTDPGVTKIIASLPNTDPVGAFANDAADVARRLASLAEENPEYAPSLKRHYKSIVNLSTGAAYQLADALDAMLQDRGKPDDRVEFPDLQNFWESSDPKVDTLRKKVEELRKNVLYSHPMLLTRNFGQGRVVAVMTSAGKSWNDWAGGGIGAFIYAPMMWEMQNYLSSQAGEASLLVGQTLPLSIDGRKYGNRELKMQRTLAQAIKDKPAKIVQLETDKRAEQAPVAAETKIEPKDDGKNGDKGKEPEAKDKEKEKDAKAEAKKEFVAKTFLFDRNLEPGIYQTVLLPANAAKGEAPLQTWSHAFNVDTRNEGNLSRASQDDLASGVLREAGENILLKTPNDPDDDLINRQTDFSESPWFFLLFLGILVAEQALAVHLSFHLRGTEADLPAAMAPAGKAA